MHPRLPLSLLLVGLILLLGACSAAEGAGAAPAPADGDRGRWEARFNEDGTVALFRNQAPLVSMKYSFWGANWG